MTLKDIISTYTTPTKILCKYFSFDHKNVTALSFLKHLSKYSLYALFFYNIAIGFGMFSGILDYTPSIISQTQVSLFWAILLLIIMILLALICLIIYICLQALGKYITEGLNQIKIVSCKKTRARNK
jgi:predicted membrane protein